LKKYGINVSKLNFFNTVNNNIELIKPVLEELKRCKLIKFIIREKSRPESNL
jgi:hypothetical protein